MAQEPSSSVPAAGDAPQASLDSLLRDSAARFPARPALTYAGRQWSYTDLDRAVDGMAARLAPRDAGGRVVAVIAPNVPALIVTLFAIWRRGDVALPLNARLREFELSRILADSGAATIVSVAAYRGYSFSDVLPRLLDQTAVSHCLFVSPDGAVDDELERGQPMKRGLRPATPDERLDPSVAALLYTSGTTGAPKGALVPQARELAGAHNMGSVLGLTADDRCLHVAPIAHAFGLTCLLATLAAGANALLTDGAFSLEPLFTALAEHKPTVLHGSPAIFTSILKAKTTLLARTGFVAGSICPPHVLEALDERGAKILNLFGMTEIGAAVCCRPDMPARIRYTTAGIPLPGYEVRVAEQGEVQVRSPYMTPGYHRQPEATAAAFVDGWFRTGDLGELDDAGHLRISGRSKEVIQVGGLNVFPAEVENFLLTHPDVEQVAVIGTPHAVMGEVLKAYVVARPGAAVGAADLLAYARARIAGYKLPYAIEFVANLPLLPSGKPDRVALQRQAQQVPVP